MELMELAIQIAAHIRGKLITYVQAIKIWKHITLFVQRDTKSKRKGGTLPSLLKRKIE